MLLNSHAQVWTLLLQYVDLAESLSMDPIEILQFLFQLGSMTLGMVTVPTFAPPPPPIYLKKKTPCFIRRINPRTLPPRKGPCWRI